MSSRCWPLPTGGSVCGVAVRGLFGFSGLGSRAGATCRLIHRPGPFLARGSPPSALPLVSSWRALGSGQGRGGALVPAAWAVASSLLGPGAWWGAACGVVGGWVVGWFVFVLVCFCLFLFLGVWRGFRALWSGGWVGGVVRAGGGWRFFFVFPVFPVFSFFVVLFRLFRLFPCFRFLRFVNQHRVFLFFVLGI